MAKKTLLQIKQDSLQQFYHVLVSGKLSENRKNLERAWCALKNYDPDDIDNIMVMCDEITKLRHTLETDIKADPTSRYHLTYNGYLMLSVIVYGKLSCDTLNAVTQLSIFNGFEALASDFVPLTK